MIILLLIILLLLTAAIYPLALEVELDYTDAGRLRVFWLPLPPWRWRVPVWRRELEQPARLPLDWSGFKRGRWRRLKPYINRALKRLHLLKLDCQTELPLELAGNAARTAVLGGLLLAGLNVGLGRLFAELAEAPGQPRLEIRLAEALRLQLQLAAYLPLGALLYIWRLYRVYSNIISNSQYESEYDRRDARGYAGESRRAAE